MGSSSWCRGRLGSLLYTKKNGVLTVAKFGVILYLVSTWFKYLSQFAGSFSQSFFNVGFRYLWKTLSLLLLCGWYGAENILSIPSCCKTWSMRLFLNSIPLSDKMYCGHICTGKYSLINVETIVSADLSGMGNASGHPVRWSIIVKMCLLPNVDVSHSVMRSIAI